MGALRAIGAIFRAAPGLDRQERADLDFVRVKMFSVKGLRLEQQVVDRQRKQRIDFRRRPVVADRGLF